MTVNEWTIKMWTAVIFVLIFASRAEAQNGRGPPPQDHSGHGWDIRLAVPGEPGNDYPTLGSIPRTTFSCAGKDPGYYADVEAGCQVFRICTVGSTYGFQSFLCPNGTLFNQQVFVCDWWMNVKCQNYQRIISAQNEKFGNLRLGPQLMKDIKKMLTHPMRNPYDKTAMKSNLIVMQDYKPPAGQLFPNSALLAGPDRPPNNIYFPSKQIQQNFQSYSPNDNLFSGSTPETRYIPAGFTNGPLNTDAEVFERQRQSAQYGQSNNVQTTQHSEIGHLVANGHTPQFTRNRNYEQIKNVPQARQHQHFNQENIQYTQNTRTNSIPNEASNIQNTQGQLNRQRAQYTDSRKLSQFNGGKQNEIASYTKQYKQDKQPYTYRPPLLRLPEESIKNDINQNFVSADVPSTVITKTLTYSKIINEPKPGRPKSRVTVKTWIVKPKSARLVAEPTSYVYEKPTQPPKQKLTAEKTSPYVYNRPTQFPQSERIIEEENSRPYMYNRPTVAPQAVDDDREPYTYDLPPRSPSPESARLEDNNDKPYVYDRPTLAPKLVITTRKDPSRSYVPPTQASPRPIQSSRLNLPPSFPPTKASTVYLAPTTFKPAARLYLPPDPQVLSRQYLPPNSPNAQLRAAPSYFSTTQAPSNVNNKNPLNSVMKQTPNYESQNNLSFTDILTKEKLDITVNDIVKDTGKILQTASPPQFGEIRQNIKSIDYPDDVYLPVATAQQEQDDESGEKLTSEAPSTTTPSKSSRLVALPARSLEPPGEILKNQQNTNRLSNLPFFKESSFPNTIERTVSLKITIPERVASYLFKGGNETDFDRLEILNTGSSNYLVLSNHLLNQNSGSTIEIDKALENKNSNISNSQALVFSFLADSLNAAKEYSNIVKQDAISSPQNLNNEDLSLISNKVSQLTSSQFSPNNFNAPNTIPAPKATTSIPQVNQLQGSTKFASQQNQAPQIQSAQYNVAPSVQAQRQLFSQQQIDNNNLNANLLDSDQQIYSGQLYQLPVPEVTNQIYNRPQSSDIIHTSLQNSQTAKLTATNQNNNVADHNLPKQSSTEVEVLQSKTLPLHSAKLQLELDNEPESFYGQESLNSLLNSANGISAQLQDKIVGTIPHPLEDSKLLTYEKDQSYYLYTKFDKNGQNLLNAKSKVNNIPSVITFQFVPSVSYQLEDEKEQQRLLNQLQIDEFGAPRTATRANVVQGPRQQSMLTSSVDYSVEHPASARLIQSPISALYKGPSSYSTPQGSVGSLPRQTLPPNYRSRLEQLEVNSEGYPKVSPARRFVF